MNTFIWLIFDIVLEMFVRDHVCYLSCNPATPHPSRNVRKFCNSRRIVPIKKENKKKVVKVCLQKFLEDGVSSNNFVLNNRLLEGKISSTRFHNVYIYWTLARWVIHHKQQISARALTGGVVLDSRTHKYFSSISEKFMLESCQHKMTSRPILPCNIVGTKSGEKQTKQSSKLWAKLAARQSDRTHGCRNNCFGSTENLVAIDVLINMHYHVFRDSWLSNVKTELHFF